MELVLVGIYSCSMLFIMIFSLVQCNLAYWYKRSTRKNNIREETGMPDEVELPVVTIQLPVYNERYVVERLLDAVTAFEYPAHLMDIQVLDDSTDDTTDIIRRKIESLTTLGFSIRHVHRHDREGFKAGALQKGLQEARGEFIAIFDADFLPSKDFIARTLPYFKNDNIGMVQTKWVHLNGDFSLLTKLQAFGLNGHFSVEQTGRNTAGSFINFNGTAGIWRKSCITDAGGWKSDTLTEDLDLSYRAQLKGWQFKYLEHYESPAELPVIMSAIKSQQFRWNKGGAETARKNLAEVMKRPIPIRKKIHAFFHLTNSTTFLFLLVASLLSIPMIYIKYKNPDMKLVFDLGSIFIIGFLAISYFYWMTVKSNYQRPSSTFIKYFPLFMTFSMGMSLHNGIAVLEGLLGFKSPFVRTPKFNIIGLNGDWQDNSYLNPKVSWITIMEGLLSLYFLSGILLGVLYGDYGLMIFHLMLAVGYAGVFYYSLKK